MIWYADDQHAGMQCELRADSSADVAKLPQFAQEQRLKPGSSGLIIDTSEVYMMRSDGQWKAL